MAWVNTRDELQHERGDDVVLWNKFGVLDKMVIWRKSDGYASYNSFAGITRGFNSYTLTLFFTKLFANINISFVSLVILLFIHDTLKLIN